MSGSVNGMVAAVIFQLVSSAGSSGRADRGHRACAWAASAVGRSAAAVSKSGFVGAFVGARAAWLRVLAACAVFAVCVLPGSEAHAQIRFSVNGLTINGQAPAVLQENDADQILNATVSYEVDSGYASGPELYLKAEPIGSNPATLSPGGGASARCSLSARPANVDVLLEDPDWVSSTGAAAGYVPASYTAGDDGPPTVQRSFAFSFGTLCQDSEVESTEQFQVTLWFGTLDAPIVVFKYIVRIVDAGRGDTGLDSAFEVTETDVDFVTLLALSLEEAPGRVRCYPYRIAYAASTADEADARLVGSDGRSPAGFGTLLAQPAATTAVSSNLLIVGDDLIEGDETLHLEVYAPGLPGEETCSPAGAPVLSVVVVIVDDDLPVGIASVEVEDADPEGNHPEGDAGDRSSVHLVVTFDRRLTEPVVVRYGSVADGTARGAPPGQDVEVVAAGAVSVLVGEIQVRVQVATILGDDRIEAVEHFRAWAAVDGGSEAAKQWVTVSIANDDVPGDTILNVVLEGEGVSDGTITEGDPASETGGGDCQGEWKCVFLILEFTSERQFKDVVYEVHTVAGSARPGEDYRFRDGVQVRLEAGHLSTLDVDDPLMLQVRQDFLVERDREDLLLAVHMMQGGESPLFSWYQRIEIVDDDSSGGEPTARLWFGLADHPALLDRGLASCPLPDATSDSRGRAAGRRRADGAPRSGDGATGR